MARMMWTHGLFSRMAYSIIATSECFYDDVIRYLRDHRHICVIDPIERIFPLLDRALTQEILQGLPQLEESNKRIRAPKYLKVLFMNISLNLVWWIFYSLISL